MSDTTCIIAPAASSIASQKSDSIRRSFLVFSGPDAKLDGLVLPIYRLLFFSGHEKTGGELKFASAPRPPFFSGIRKKLWVD